MTTMFPPEDTAQAAPAAYAETMATRVAVLGLGYVGLPLAVALAAKFDCIGVDIDARRISELVQGHDRTGEIAPERLAASSLALLADPAQCPPADFYIVTVPTPIDAANRPDLRLVEAASRTIGAMLPAALAEGRVPVVVYESTVYPGVTEEICAPILEAASGLVCGQDFFLGYSPERINPGDREHTIDKITKVVSGQTPLVLERVAELYSAITSGGVFRAASIKAAEAAKVIENAQRDINIAFMNEIAQIFSAMDLSVWDVLEAAGTKWNFLPFSPGLVGGHCIGVDPYYLAHRATQLGHDPRVILAGRGVNDGMGAWVAHMQLDASPHSIGWQQDQLLRWTHPSTHGQLQQDMAVQAKRLIDTNASTVFWLQQVAPDADRQRVAVVGQLDTYVNGVRVDGSSRQVTYMAQFESKGGRMLLKEWKAVPGDDIWLARMLEKLEREREAKEKTSAKK